MQYSIVKFSEVKKLTDSLRLDAEFFQDLSIINFMNNFDLYSTSELCFITDGEHGSPDWDQNTNIKYIVAENIKPNYILENNFKTISLLQHTRNTRSIIQEDDVLIYSVGGRGYVSKAEKHLFPCNIPRSVAILRLLNKNIMLPEYLSLFLNSKYGAFQIQRLQAGNVQPMLSIENIKKINLISLTMEMQSLLSSLYNTSYILRQKAKEQYKKAEDILLEELGFKDYKLKHQLSYIKTFAEVQKEERLDAEYYQPKYEDIILKIKNKNYELLSNIVNINKCIEPGSEEYQEYGIPFIRVSNLSKFGLSKNNQKYLSESFYNQHISHQPQKGDILLSKDGTVCVAYFLDSQPNKIICSGGILRLSIKHDNVLPEYLTLLLNSIIVSSQAERDSGGALISHWLIGSIENTLIPIIDLEHQKSICSLINSCTNDRNKSKQLLEIATKAVEMAIEQNEEIATEWIHSQLQSIDVKI